MATYLYIFIFIFLIIILSAARYKRAKDKLGEIRDSFVLRILVPLNNDKKALAAEQLFQALNGIKFDTNNAPHFSFEILADKTGIHFVVVCPIRFKNFLMNQIYAQYPEAQIQEMEDYVKINSKEHIISSELGLAKEYYLPIKTFESFEVDPLASITSALSNLHNTEVWIQVLARPLPNKWQENQFKIIDNLTQSNIKNIKIEEIEKKFSKSGYQFKIRILIKGEDVSIMRTTLEDVIAYFKQFHTSHENSIVPIKESKDIFLRVYYFLLNILIGKSLKDKLSILEKYKLRFLDIESKNIINISELASIYHLPNESVKTSNIAWSKSKKIEFPLNLPTKLVQSEEQIRMFGLTDYRNIHLPFGIKKADRRRHMYLLGKTGTGKSTLLKNMIIGDIIDGNGLAVLDPHGDLVEEILNIIPENRVKDVIYIDPSDIENPIGFNMLSANPEETKDLLADGIVNVFKKFFGESWGPRLEYLLNYSVLTLLHCQNVSLLAIVRILSDSNYRKFLLKQVKDPFIIKFWEEEFEQLSKNPRLLTEAISPIQNKVGRFLGPTMIRNMVGQLKSNIDLQDIMNTGKILLINLSQGKIGEENSSLLGALMVTRLYANAMQRSRLLEKDRKDFYLYVDEFQNFATESFVKILSEARKYGLNLIVTHQYIDQIDEKIQNAIFGNVGTLMNYVVG